LTVFFALSGSERPKAARKTLMKLTPALVKAASKMLVKLTPGVNFTNILYTNFPYESCFGSFLYLHVTREKLSKQHLYEKFARKMLVKLTPDFIKMKNYQMN